MYSHESLCIIIFYYYNECKSDDVITDLLRACRGLDIIMRKCLYTHDCITIAIYVLHSKKVNCGVSIYYYTAIIYSLIIMHFGGLGPVLIRFSDQCIGGHIDKPCKCEPALLAEALHYDYCYL